MPSPITGEGVPGVEARPKIMSAVIQALVKRPKVEYPCAVHAYHWPRPLRRVRHHIWPQAEGGPSISENLVWVCDTGHYNIHTALLALEAGIQPSGTKKEIQLAQLGLERKARKSL